MARSGCIYGPTGTFKTTAIAHMARYIAERYGKSTLLLSADGGGWSPCQEEIDAGMIRPFRVDTATIPLPMIRKVSQGYWPANPEERDVSRVDFRRPDWSEIGAVAVEGFTSIGTMLMRHLADKNIKTGEEGTSKFVQPIVVEGQVTMESFAGSSKGHYGFAQNQLYGMTMNFISLPVEYVLFTAHEKRMEDDDRTTVYGISVPGKAIGPLVPTWIGDLLHAQDYAVTKVVKGPAPGKPGELVDVEVVDTVCRYYFKRHPDPTTGIMFPAKPRVAHNQVRRLEQRFPGGYFEPSPEHGFDLYLKALDELAEEGGKGVGSGPGGGPDDTLRKWRERQDAKLGRAAKPIAAVSSK